MVDKNDTLLREVDEELRREQLEKLWQRYGWVVISAAVLFVASVAIYKWVESGRIAAAQSAGARFEQALRLKADGKPDEAIKAFSGIAADGPRGYAALAKLQMAVKHAEAGRTAEALASYESLAQDGGADDLLRGFAQLQAAALRLGEADFTEMQNRLNDLVGDASPWRASARELLGLAALKAGKTAEARREFERLLGDAGTPPGIGDRVKIVMASLVAAELANKTAQPATAGAATTPEKK
jgi:hypothetical protein